MTNRFFLRVWVGCLFLMGLSISGCSEYSDHYSRETTQVVTETGSVEFRWSWSLFILPDVSVQSSLISQFSQAKERLWVEIYTWTDQDTIEALLAAHRRWVDTRVILEGNVYGTPTINQKTYQKLRDAEVPVVYADNSHYTFTHAKFWIIDDQFCMSTGNLTFTGYKKNRDFIYCDSSTRHLESLSEVFRSDFLHEKPLFSTPLPSSLGLSPINMRDFLTNYITGAKSSLVIYVQSLSDEDILSLLEAKKKAGVHVEICVAQNDDTQTLSLTGIMVHTVKKPYLHAKAIIRDGRDILLGSMNLTQNAIDNNREAGIILENNSPIVSSIKRVISSDCGVPKFAK